MSISIFLNNSFPIQGDHFGYPQFQFFFKISYPDPKTAKLTLYLKVLIKIFLGFLNLNFHENVTYYHCRLWDLSYRLVCHKAGIMFQLNN